MSRGQFQLRKWASNHEALLVDLPLNHLEKSLTLNSEDGFIKVLGLMWDLSEDVFTFHVSAYQGLLTKRNILSYIAKIYDPLGFLAPIVFQFKWFLQ